MFGPKKTRSELSETLGMKGKQLADFLRTEVVGGRMIRRMVFKDPVRGGLGSSSISPSLRT